METLERTPPQPQAAHALRALSLPALDWGAIATWLLAALLVVYLGLENGGYDPIPRDQVGIAVWWIVLLGVAVEALARHVLHGAAPRSRAPHSTSPRQPHVV